MKQLTLFPIRERRCRACKRLFMPDDLNQRFCDWLCEDIYKADRKSRRVKARIERRQNGFK